MSTKKIKRITKQVRVSEKSHILLKSFAKHEKMTLSKFVDLLVKTHLNKII